MGSTSFNVRTLRTTPKADPPPGLVWQSGGPDQKFHVTDIGFVFLNIFEHAYLACVRRARMALRSDDSTLEIAYNYIITVGYMVFTCSAMKSRSDLPYTKGHCAGIWAKESGI